MGHPTAFALQIRRAERNTVDGRTPVRVLTIGTHSNQQMQATHVCPMGARQGAGEGGLAYIGLKSSAKICGGEKLLWGTKHASSNTRNVMTFVDCLVVLSVLLWIWRVRLSRSGFGLQLEHRRNSCIQCTTQWHPIICDHI